VAKGFIRPPRLRAHEQSEESRRATWLELFFDLLFVVAVAQLAEKITHGLRWSAMAAFVALFVPTWWLWIDTTFYATRFFADDDVLYRFFTFLQMCGIAGLAVTVRDGFGTGARGFALSYAAVRVVLVIEYLRAGRHLRDARPLTSRYARGFTIAAAIWIISAFVPAPTRFALWAVGLAIDVSTPLLGGRIHSDIAPDDSHLPERFGQFTLIVLGEGVFAVVVGIDPGHLTLAVTTSAVCAFCIAFSLAWIYFESLDGSAIHAARAQGHIITYQVWLYTHFPLVVALTGAGVGIEYVVTNPAGAVLPDNARWLIGGSVAVALIATGVIHWTSAPPENRTRDRARTRLRVIAGGIMLLLTAIGRGTAPVLVVGVIATICAAQVVIDVLNDGEIPATTNGVNNTQEGV